MGAGHAEAVQVTFDPAEISYRELLELEEQHPTLRTADSPTQRVGAEPASQLVKHTHLVPMLSLANAFNDEELAAWEERLVRMAGEDVRRSGYNCELKIDGAAVKDERQGRIVRDRPVISEGHRDGSGVFGGGRHKRFMCPDARARSF